MSDFAAKNFYERLGLSREATVDEIKAAYADIAKIYHPDSHFYDELLTDDLKVMTPRQEEVFRLVTEAYNTLISKEKRIVYDRTLAPETPQWQAVGQSRPPERAQTTNNEGLKKEPEVVAKVEIVVAEPEDRTPTQILSVTEMIQKERERQRRETRIIQVKRRNSLLIVAGAIAVVSAAVGAMVMLLVR